MVNGFSPLIIYEELDSYFFHWIGFVVKYHIAACTIYISIPHAHNTYIHTYTHIYTHTHTHIHTLQRQAHTYTFSSLYLASLKGKREILAHCVNISGIPQER